MKTRIISFVFILFMSSAFSQGPICIQHGNAVLFTSRLDSAIILAQNDDYIYLPGNVVPSLTSGGTFNITKRVNIVGCGYNADSCHATGISTIAYPITFAAGSDNSSITGVYLPSYITINTSGITVTRCNFNNLYIGTANLSNIAIIENIVRDNLNGPVSPLSNVFFSKNIIAGTNPLGNLQGVTISNNIFLFSQAIGYTQLLCGVNNCLIKNNIIRNYFAVFQCGATNNIFQNNLFTNTYLSSNTDLQSYGSAFNNIFQATTANTFVNVTNDGWNGSQNYHLKAGSPGINGGSDGTDIGIYGTDLPFKDGGLPFNPHFTSIVVPGTTGSNGTLDINIQVKVQDH